MFSIFDSHVKREQYYYKSKHAGTKRVLNGNQEDASLTVVDDSGDEIIGLTENKNFDMEEKASIATYKKLTQKFNCDAYFNVNKLKLTKIHMYHNHTISLDTTTMLNIVSKALM